MIPLQLILLSIPSIVYILAHRRRGAEWRQSFSRVGWIGGPVIWYLWALGVTLILGMLGFFAFQQVPPEILDHPNVAASQYEGLTLSLSAILTILVREAFYVALGEEVFFRGFLGGWLFRRFGFQLGNAIQAVVFLLPHLLLLTVSMELLPIIPIQFIAGWMYGWLRCRSGSIFPGWLSHTLLNALGALAFLIEI
jgi:uncharacterized protein